MSTRAKSLSETFGFSLIEVMVAVSLMAVIIVGLLAMFYQTQRAFRSGASQMDVMEGGRAGAELIAREAQEMAPIRVFGDTNFLATYDPDFTFEQAMLSGYSRLNAAYNISFYVRNNDTWKIVAYHVTNPASKALNAGAVDPFVLTRFVLETNASPEIVAQIRSLIGSATGPYPYPEDQPMTTPFRRVLDGVVNFTVSGFNGDGRIDSQFGAPNFVYSTGIIRMTNAANPNGIDTVTNFFPAALDLELSILEPRALAKFKAKLANLPLAYAYLTNQAGSVHDFRQRIPIRTTP